MDTITVQFIDIDSESHYTTEVPAVPRIGEHVSFDYHQIGICIVGRVVNVHWYIDYFPDAQGGDVDHQMMSATVYVQPTH